jgi:acyl carrier protein
MNDTSVENQVKIIVAKLFNVPVEQVDGQYSSNCIEAWDSLGHLNLVLALEQEFTIRFLPDEVEKLTDVLTITTLIQRKLSKM